MKKVKLQLQTSLDGFIADKDGGMEWITRTSDKDFGAEVHHLIDTSDTIILGCKLAAGFIPYWEDVITHPNDPQNDFAHKMVNTPKVVFSKTMTEPNGNNTTIANGDLVTEIGKLKSREGKDIIVYGGGSLASALIKEGLIDEYYLFMNPAALGKGLSIYQLLNDTLKLKLVSTKAFHCGIVLLCYQPA